MPGVSRVSAVELEPGVMREVPERLKLVLGPIGESAPSTPLSPTPRAWGGIKSLSSIVELTNLTRQPTKL